MGSLPNIVGVQRGSEEILGVEAFRIQHKKIYAEYYSWDVWDWLYNRTVAHSCDEPASACNGPTWPTDAELVPTTLFPGEKERNHREEHYTVVFTEKDGSTHDFHPQSERELLAHPIRSSAHIRYGIAHGVEILP